MLRPANAVAKRRIRSTDATASAQDHPGMSPYIFLLFLSSNSFCAICFSSTPSDKTRKEKCAEHHTTYLFMSAPTQLHSGIVEAWWQAVAHTHRIVHTVRLWLDGKVSHMRSGRHRRAHGPIGLDMEVGLVGVMLPRMGLHLVGRMLLVRVVLRMRRLAGLLLLLVETSHAGQGERMRRGAGRTLSVVIDGLRRRIAVVRLLVWRRTAVGGIMVRGRRRIAHGLLLLLVVLLLVVMGR